MSALDLVLVVARLAVGCWLLWSVPVVIAGARSRSQPGSGSSPVTVVIPARDEARSLPALLDSIPTGVEVVVVDDHSRDDTAVQAALAGARVVESAPLPEGWTGKAWACQQGADVATGEMLAFVDADVRFAPGALEAVVDEAAARGGLVSVQPFHEPGRPVEQLASIFNVVGLAGADVATPLGRRRGARGAFGPVLVARAADHRRLGGHERVRASVVDDVALAAAYRAAGEPVRILGGGDAVSARMYPGGLRDLVDGFTKNLAAGAGAVRATTTLLVVAWLSLLVQAAVAPVRAAVAGDTLDLGVAVVLYLVVATQYWWMARRVGRFGAGVALTFPVSLVLFLAVFVRSVVGTLRGTLSWRGRQVPTR